MVALSWLRDTRRTMLDIARVTSDMPQYPRMGQGMTLFKVTGYLELSATDKRYAYTMREAVVTSAGTYLAGLSANAPSYTGVSVSELSNASLHYSYGVLKVDLPAGFDAVQIPTGAYVAAFPHYMADGGVVWCIVNTQAIEGTCTALTDLTDGGLYTGEAPE